MQFRSFENHEKSTKIMIFGAVVLGLRRGGSDSFQMGAGCNLGQKLEGITCFRGEITFFSREIRDFRDFLRC